MNTGHCNNCNWDNQWLDDNGKCISCWIDEDDKNIDEVYGS